MPDILSIEVFKSTNGKDAVMISLTAAERNEGFSSKESKILLSVTLPITIPCWVIGN
ncbi:hypothetical protein FQZ97_689640 [compost metagenome]